MVHPVYNEKMDNCEKKKITFRGKEKNQLRASVVQYINDAEEKTLI